MELIAIALIGTAVFGVVTAISVFIRQLLLSRDKRLNDKAQQRALEQEAKELEKIRTSMENFKRLESHYQVLGENKEAIEYLDQKIEALLSKKFALVERYASMTLKESSAAMNGSHSIERKEILDELRHEIDEEIACYDEELQQLQARRDTLWTSHSELKDYLLEQEKVRNEKLDNLYHRHSSILEKVYLRHNENSENITKKAIDASTDSFNVLLVPWRYLMKFFGLATGVSKDKVAEETEARKRVSEAEDDINQSEINDLNSSDNEMEEVFEDAESIPEL